MKQLRHNYDRNQTISVRETVEDLLNQKAKEQMLRALPAHLQKQESDSLLAMI